MGLSEIFFLLKSKVIGIECIGFLVKVHCLKKIPTPDYFFCYWLGKLGKRRMYENTFVNPTIINLRTKVLL